MVRQFLTVGVAVCCLLPAWALPDKPLNSEPSAAERGYVVGSSLGLLEGFVSQCKPAASVEIPLLKRFKAEVALLAKKPDSQLSKVIETGRQHGKASAETFIETTSKAEFCAQFLAKAPLMTEADVERAIALTKRGELYKTGDMAESFAMGYAYVTLEYAKATCELSTESKESIPKLRQPYWETLSEAQRKAFREGETMGQQMIDVETSGKTVVDNCTGMNSFVRTAVTLFQERISQR